MPSRNLYPLDGANATNYDKGMDITNSYDVHPGICVLPLAEDPPETEEELVGYSPVVVLRLHAPFRERKVSYKADKSNNPPVMPSPVSAGAFIFVGGNIAVHNSVSIGNVGFDWQMATTYSYIEDCSSRPGDGLVLGTPPWVSEVTLAAAQQIGVVPTYVGPVAAAGPEVVVARTAGEKITFDPSAQKGAYYYPFSCLYPGTFFNNFLVNGGPPVFNPQTGNQ